MNHPNLVVKWDEAPVELERQPESMDEMLVQLDGVEAIPRQQPAEDFPGHRAGTGTDFQDATRGPWPRQGGGERPGQESTAGEERASGPEVAPRHPPERSALTPEAHSPKP
jgi:hypothetical protein